MGNKRVVLAASDFWYLWKFRLKLINELNSRGYSVCLASGGGAGFKEADLTTRAQVQFVDLRFQSGNTNIAREVLTLLRVAIFCFRERRSLFLLFTPKVNIYFSFFTLIFGCKAVVNVSGQGTLLKSSGLKKSAYRLVYRSLLSHMEHVFFQNINDREFFDLSTNNSSLLPGSGVDLNYYQKNFEPGTPLRVFMACRLIRDKGVVEYLEAVESFSGDDRVEFILAGREDFSSRAVSLQFVEGVSERVPNFQFVGEVEDVKDIGSKTHVFVLPSSYGEGVPRFLLEGLALGRIIVTSNGPGCRETVIDGINGLVLRACSSRDIRNALEKILKMNESDKLRMSQASRQIAETNFDESIVLDAYRRLTP